MIRREPFNLAGTPLKPDTTLIEASAGTGKTFTIAGLFLRLILERDFSVREILVVTFTEAATEELRGRIRERLSEASAALVTTGATGDEVLREILQPHLAQRDEMLARLDRALGGFDEAPIFTIHGFCQRTLRDRAFESGALFDVELLKDDSRLLEEIADDFWRRHFYEAGALPVQFLLKNRYRPERFLPLLRVRNRHPMLEVISGVGQKRSAELFAALEETFEQARVLWQKNEAEIRTAIGDGAWAKGDHTKPGTLEEMWRALAECFDDSARTPESLEALAFFASQELDKHTREDSQTPTHAFFRLCHDIAGHERDYLTGLDLEFLDFAAGELPRRKEQLKVVCFDDLLARLHSALRGRGGKALAAEIRARYSAALIDEFQDTDPVQYEIFREIFVAPAPDNGAADAPFTKTADARSAANGRRESSAARPLLFLIGDPKQAIYGFRGADIFTYLDAAGAVDQSYTLGRNFRSESGLVRAVNTLLSGVEKPFLFEEIQFQPVGASDRGNHAPLRDEGKLLPPLQLWFMPREGEAKEITKERAEALLPDIVATEIVRLLNGDVRLGDARLSPRDIAVLVPENRHARLMQEALRSRRVPSVLFTEESVFDSREARELERVLAAIAQPASERLIRAALVTDLLGMTGSEIEQLAGDEAKWQRHLERFLDYFNLWQERGFTPMFRGWLQAEGVRQRLLKFMDGERRLTNLLHLAEVLHHAAVEQRSGIAGLARWLSEQIASEEKAEEEYQLRLERDDQAVKLVTIHKSKGLEYPVVFCPFSWKSSDNRRGAREPVFFHEREQSGMPGQRAATRFYCDLGTARIEEHRERAVEESLAENLRLLYVALTRARNRCYLVWGGFRGAGTSAAAWLLHPPAAIETNVRDAMNARFTTLTDAAMQWDLERLIGRSADDQGSPAIQWSRMPAHDAQPYVPVGEPAAALQTRVFDGLIARDWRIVSFSALTAERREEAPDYDAEPGPEPTPPDAEIEGEGIFAFPRGTNAGTCLHKVFEALDFTSSDDAALLALTREQLVRHGFLPGAYASDVCEMVRRTLSVPLTPGEPESVLANVPMGERLNELEFFFPIERLTPALLQSAMARANSSRALLAQLGRLGFQPSGGFVKGFIDLVFRRDGRFYLIDWKSNWLGNRVEDYGPESMAAAMVEHLYPLQYHLYTVALHRYLKLRLRDYDYDRHFGGIRYLFLRGLDPARPEFGVFRDRPPAAWVEEFSAQLACSKEES